MDPSSGKETNETKQKSDVPEASTTLNETVGGSSQDLVKLIVNHSLSSLSELTPLGQPNYLSSGRDAGFFSGFFGRSLTFDYSAATERRQCSLLQLPVITECPRVEAPTPQASPRVQKPKPVGEAAESSDPLNHSKLYVPEILLPNGKKRLGKSSRFHYFRPLIVELCKFFQGEKTTLLDDSFHLLDWELALRVVKRKFALKHESGEPQRKEDVQRELAQTLAELTFSKPKRTEEYNKFVYKHTLKRLKQNFARDHKRPQSSEQDFYQFYFQELVRSDPKYEISHFFDPLHGREGLSANGAAKSLSLQYLGLVFRSPKFRQAFERYLCTPSPEESEFWRDYSRGIRKKLERIFYSWERKFQKTEHTLRVRDKMLSYILKSNQCKLPWTRAEVLAAVSGFRDKLLAAPNPPGLSNS